MTEMQALMSSMVGNMVRVRLVGDSQIYAGYCEQFETIKKDGVETGVIKLEIKRNVSLHNPK